MIRTVLISLGMLLLLAAPGGAKSKAPAAQVEPEYVSALATANQFLHACQTNDQETGILMLTDRLKHKTDEDSLESLFSSTAHALQSFEIGRGKRLGPGRYQFPVTLFQKPGIARKWTHPQSSALVVVKAAKDDWAIDRLP